jgi:hypothetical protein
VRRRDIDRVGNEGAIFMDYVAMQSCTSGRNAFFTDVSTAHRHDPAATAAGELPGHQQDANHP